MTGTSTSAEASVAYAATDTCLVKAQTCIFLFNLHIYIPQDFLAVEVGGAANSILMLPLKSRFGAVLMPFGVLM